MNWSIKLWRLRIFRYAVCPAIVAGAVALALCQLGESAMKPSTPDRSVDCGGAGSKKILAKVGNHVVTQADVDSRIATQLYDLRKQALDNIIDDYVLHEAARKAGLKPNDYLLQQIRRTSPPVTASEAEKFYGEHKAQLDAQTGGKSLGQIEPRLIAALQREHDREAQQALLARLRAENHVTVLLEPPHLSVASAGHPSAGPSSAPVTIVEFSDFQCPFCRAAEPSLKEVRKKYGDRIRLVYMDFPLNFHAHAMEAARAARCAGEQNKFWQFHDALFADQKRLDADSLKRTAARLGLDTNKFDACFASDKHTRGIQQDVAEGNALGVSGTPTFFINGRELAGVQPLPKLNEVIDEELARAKAAGSSQATK
jgi:protein-disulfide isomerase